MKERKRKKKLHYRIFPSFTFNSPRWFPFFFFFSCFKSKDDFSKIALKNGQWPSMAKLYLYCNCTRFLLFTLFEQLIYTKWFFCINLSKLRNDTRGTIYITNIFFFPRDVIGSLIISIINRPFILFIIAFGRKFRLIITDKHRWKNYSNETLFLFFEIFF